MTNYELIGIGTTDNNGIAHLDHDANGDPITHSYTGTGAGEIDIVASLDSEIDESSILSETSVLDCLFYDGGTSTPINSHWYNSSNFNITCDSTGMLIENNSSSDQYILANDPSTSGSSWANTYDWDNTVECKFEIVSYDGSCYYMKDDETNGRKWINTTGEVTVRPSSSTKVQLGFRVGQGTKLKIKNFRIYPI